ncbi:hypothetical protein Tco_1056742 [Tanacetum coccineum]|uniref:Uncharacterized protein n=1 Tax=Tanacetum coccineum TaxID=301880 RepID=A0ABQ5H3D9_9ASTR
MTFGGNTRDLGSFGEETDKTTTLQQILEEVVHTECGDGVTKSETLNVIHLRLSDLEKEVKEVKNVDHSSALLSKIKSKVPNAVKEYLGTSLDDALYKVLKKHDADIIKEFSVPTEIVERLTQQYLPHPKNKALYHALMESIFKYEDTMDKGVADELKKRKPNDADKDEGPSAGSDRGLKRQRTSKGTETYKKTYITKDSSKGKSLATSSKSSKSGKSAKDQGEDLGKTDEQPNDEHVPKNDWYKKSKADTSPDLEWNEGKSVDDGPEQRLAYNLLKGTCKSYVKLDYTMEECYRAFYEQLDWNNPEGHRFDFFFNNDLEYLRGGRNDKKYTASMTKSKAAWYELKGIEYMVPNLWSLHDVYSTKRILSVISVKVNEWYGYGHLEEIVVKRADKQLYTFKEGNFKRLHLNDIKDMLLLIVQNKLNNLDGNVVVHLAASLRMFARRTVIQARVEDLQLGVESYQKKLNFTKLRTRDVDMSRRLAYTTLSNTQCVIYEDNLKRKRFMRADELHKFSDGTLISVHDTLSQILHELHLRAINQKLLDRRIMRSLEKFVGGREYEEDLRLL